MLHEDVITNSLGLFRVMEEKYCIPAYCNLVKYSNFPFRFKADHLCIFLCLSPTQFSVIAGDYISENNKLRRIHSC